MLTDAAEPEVLEVFDALFRTLLDERDPAAGTALFADDDDVTMWGSDVEEHAVGHDQLAELHRAIAGSPSTISFRWDDRRVHVEGDVAWVAAEGECTVERDQAPPQTIAYRLLGVLVRRDGARRWHAFSGAEPQPS
jgi:ketosteroid isomerase-like protein